MRPNLRIDAAQRRRLPRMGGCVAVLAALVLAGCADSLHDVAARGDLKAVAAILAKDPALVNQPGHKNKTPMHYTVMYQRREAMAFLLEKGADLAAKDITGMTPLHEAAARGYKDEAAWLLEQGADLEARDSFGDTPLHTAAAFGQGPVLQFLLEHGADIQAENEQGLTPVEVARKYCQAPVVRFLERRLASKKDH